MFRLVQVILVRFQYLILTIADLLNHKQQFRLKFPFTDTLTNSRPVYVVACLYASVCAYVKLWCACASVIRVLKCLLSPSSDRLLHFATKITLT